MRRPLWSVSKRPRLKVSLEDRFQDEQQRTLDHAVADCGDAQHADLSAAVLGDLPLPVRHGDVLARDQFVPNLIDEAVHSALLDGREGHPVDARGTAILLGQAVGFVERLPLADVDEQAPETPRRFRLRLGVDLPSQVLQTDERLCHPLLPLFHG
jgi:hypothetical protein